MSLFNKSNLANKYIHRHEGALSTNKVKIAQKQGLTMQNFHKS